MAGMRVVVVKAGADGAVDLDDLRAQCDKHADDLAAIMVTYPSTHGAYEDTITELCEIVHDHGGQVYVDGANLNALLGYAKPGEFGGDVSHLNLHKTFCIPHGGGGPGVGPVAVREHLAPYLPSHDLHPEESKRSGIGPISAAPYGSAGILPISWAYIRLMGAEGLTRATACAVLSANYVAARLGEHFPVLYRGHGDLVAHECILDVRGLTKDTGVSVDDVAKRLIDYGFHAPTMSFPVAGTLMVEPTESEDLAEIDRFCDAMIAIRAEIDRVGAGEWTPETSPLRGAPHTSRALVGEWDRPYSRELGGLPDRDRPRQVLAAGRPGRPGLRRPQPGLLLPAVGGVRRVSPRAARGRLAAPPRGAAGPGSPALGGGRGAPGGAAGLVGRGRRPRRRPRRCLGRGRLPDRVDHQDPHRGRGPPAARGGPARPRRPRGARAAGDDVRRRDGARPAQPHRGAAERAARAVVGAVARGRRPHAARRQRRRARSPDRASGSTTPTSATGCWARWSLGCAVPRGSRSSRRGCWLRWA